MAVRAFLIFACFSLAIAACSDHGVGDMTMAVTKLVNTVSNQTSTFTYRRNKLSTFKSVLNSATLANMTFHFAGDQLVYISHDSTETSIKKTLFYYNSDNTIDSTFFYGAGTDGDTTYLISTRTVTYNALGNPVKVDLKTWSTNADAGVIMVEDHAELTWEGGNVTRLITTEKDVTITHNDKKSIYIKRPEYIYTLALKDLFWLSENSPQTFNDGSGEKSYYYDYNKLGYPATYQSDTGTVYTLSYTQLL